jgi:hypothetical protein
MPWPGQASQHDADHSEAGERSSAAGIAFEVSREASMASDPLRTYQVSGSQGTAPVSPT